MKNTLLSYLLLFLTLQAKAQVAVSKEPRHHVVFENKKLRVLNVLLRPGDTTQYHVHSTPSVFIFFTKTRTISQLINEQPVESTSNAGTILFDNLNPPHTRTHRVWNVDTGTFHVMDIEILSRDPGFTSKPLAIEHLQQIIDTPWTRTYKIELAKDEQVTVNNSTSDFVLVALDKGTTTVSKQGKEQNLLLKEGSFFCIKPSEYFTLSNPSDIARHFALVEIK